MYIRPSASLSFNININIFFNVKNTVICVRYKLHTDVNIKNILANDVVLNDIDLLSTWQSCPYV